MTEDVQSTETSDTTLFCYVIDHYRILLESQLKTEIIEQRETFPIPHAPEWCKGMISLRGKLIPVLDTHRLLGCAVPKQLQWLLVVESTPLPAVAICIDSLPTQYQYNPDQFELVDEGLPFWFKQIALEPDKAYQVDHQQLFQLLASQTTPSTDLSGIEA